jgi:predicted phage terminase large subunit-like protein
MAKQKLLKEKQFLDELHAFADEQRRLVEAECEGFATDHAARDQRQSRVQHDYEYFCKTYFPHFIKGPPSLFHRWFFDNVPRLLDEPDGQYINISAPRGEAKSTLGTQLMTLWQIITKRQWLIPIMMDTTKQAMNMMEAIKVELESNPRLQMDFPEACGRGRVWNVGIIVTASGRKIQAFGLSQSVRGLKHGPHRPGLVLLDDLENNENVRSKDQRDKLDSKIKTEIMPLGPPDGSMKLLYLNTILHHDSVANRCHVNPLWLGKKFRAIVRLPDRMDLWQEWEALFINDGPQISDAFFQTNKEAMEAGAIVSWPEMRPLLRLMKLRAADHHAFDCEYQNDPTNSDAAVFTNMQYWVHPSRDWVFYGAHDPSMGKSNKSRDPSACLVGGFDRNHGKLSVVEALIARMLPDLQISRIIDFHREYKCLAWGIENIQFQEFFRTELVKRSAAAGIPVPALPVTPHTDKDLRIEALAPHANNGLILFRQEHKVLNEQLRQWYPGCGLHDDGPDALEMLWKLALSRAGGIPRIRTGPRK